MAEIGVVPGGGLPWGDIVKAQTPFTDQVTASLLAQNADRRKYQQETTQHADELMTKELANVRSADMNQVIDNYGKWKNISMQMLNPKVQSDPKVYNQLQQQRNAALGQTMATINKSAQLNAQAKELVAERKTKPNLYNDDFGDRLAEFNKTPMDQLQNHPKYGDLSNPDAFRYQGAQTDFAKLEASAGGQPKAIEGADKIEKISDLQTRRTPTLFGSTPSQFFENMKGQLAQHIPGRDAAAAWEAIPEPQKAAVDQQYAAIAPEKWQAMTGTTKPQVIAPADPNNPAENYAAYRAKVYAINAAPRAGTPQMVVNQDAKMTRQSELTTTRQLTLEAAKEKDAEKRIALQKKLGYQYRRLSAADQATALDNAYDDLIGAATTDQDGQPKEPSDYNMTSDGKVSKEYVLPASDATNKVYSIPDDKGHPIYPDKTLYDPVRKTVTPIFYFPGKAHTLDNIDHTVSKSMTESEYKARYGGALFGKKAAAEAFSTKNPGAAPASAPPTSGSGIKWQ